MLLAWKLKKEEHPLQSWQQLPFNWQGEAASSGIIYQTPASVVLEMDGIVEMVVLRQDTSATLKTLEPYDPPHYKKAMINGELWSYGHWAALVDEDRIRELWITREHL